MDAWIVQSRTSLYLPRILCLPNQIFHVIRQLDWDIVERSSRTVFEFFLDPDNSRMFGLEGLPIERKIRTEARSGGNTLQSEPLIR